MSAPPRRSGVPLAAVAQSQRRPAKNRPPQERFDIRRGPAAALLGVDRATIRRMVQRGELSAMRWAGDLWLSSRECQLAAAMRRAQDATLTEEETRAYANMIICAEEDLAARDGRAPWVDPNELARACHRSPEWAAAFLLRRAELRRDVMHALASAAVDAPVPLVDAPAAPARPPAPRARRA